MDITKIQKMSIEATAGLDGVSQSELELDSHIKFIDGMNSSDIQDALIKTAVEKIDIDVPNWTFVAARLRLYDLYHEVGKVLGNVKGNSYGLHDASWRSRFGGNIYTYNGSHGCVNMPRSEVSKLYNMVEIGTPVYVH